VSAVVASYGKVVAGRVSQGVPAFLVTLALALSLTIVFARVFATVSETPFLRHRSRSGPAPRQHPPAEGAHR
jgi:hypothetical protein